MDVLDQMMEIEERRMKALKKTVRVARESLPSNKFCDECGTDIPEKRRELGGVKFCVDCQEVLDSKRKRNGGRF